MTLSKKLPLVLSALVALVALVAAPAASAAGSVSTTKACFVAEGSEGVSVGVSGSGFTPGELVFAQIPAPGGLAGFSEATVAPDGTVNTTIEHVFPEGIDPVAEEMKIQIAGVLTQQVLAESAFQITNLGVATKPAVAPFNKVVKYTFAGFRPGAPIFGHYFRHNKLVVTHKFGLATGPCGLLSTKAKLFPGHGPNGAKYKVQFDDSK
ncbi:MAG TPA: hypothetical protein VJ204_06945, partial [Solirubrobacterales bacterium]|nr:hypothetical protein [Solirubrobacterales bacterium]